MKLICFWREYKTFIFGSSIHGSIAECGLILCHYGYR